MVKRREFAATRSELLRAPSVVGFRWPSGSRWRHGLAEPLLGGSTWRPPYAACVTFTRAGRPPRVLSGGQKKKATVKHWHDPVHLLVRLWLIASPWLLGSDRTGCYVEQPRHGLSLLALLRSYRLSRYGRDKSGADVVLGVCFSSARVPASCDRQRYRRKAVLWRRCRDLRGGLNAEVDRHGLIDAHLAVGPPTGM